MGNVSGMVIVLAMVIATGLVVRVVTKDRSEGNGSYCGGGGGNCNSCKFNGSCHKNDK